MSTYLTYVDGTSAKFWQIHVDGCSHTVTFGKIGTTGQSKTKTFDDETACQKDADKLIKAKKAKGYSEDGTPVQPSTSKPNQKNNTDKTAIFAEFDEIIKNGDLNQVVPFLTAHKNGNVSELKKRLNKARHYYLDWQDLNPTGKSDWGRRGDANHERMLFCLALGLLSASDFNGRWFDCFISVLRYMDDPKFYTIKDYKNNSYQMVFDIIKHFEFKELFNAYFAESIKQDLGGVDYWILHKLETHDLIDYHAQSFASGLAVSSLPKTLNWEYKLNLDEYREQFLGLDIPSRDLKSLFEYETNISWDYIHGLNIPKEYKSSTWQYVTEHGGNWLYLLPKFIEQGQLERDWVLQKCIEIQSNFWKQTTKKFYKDLFKALNPTEQELLNLQDSLFMLLQHELKPTVNFALDSLKPLIHHQAFNFAEFMTFIAPMMMNGEFKNSIKSLLTQFDKILKTHPQHMTLIYPSLCHVLFINDLSLQEKAAKLLVKYANQDTLGDDWDNLISHIETLFDSLPNDIKALLAPLYQTQDEINESKTEHIIQNLLSDMTYHYDPMVRLDYFADDKKINLYSEFNDILFNFGQLEYSNNPIDFEIFMASWLQLKANQQFPSDYIEQLQSVLSKYRHQWFNHGLFCLFKNEFINEIFQNKDEKTNFSFNDFKFMFSYYELVNKFIALNQQNQTLPLLSTPTHFPAFIQPKTLVERLIAYQNANIEIDLTDYAIALARMPRVDIEPAIELLSEIKNELIVESLKFAFGLIKITETVPSIQQMQLMGVERSQEQIDKLNANIIERENKLADMSHNQNIAKGLLDKAKKAIENTVKAFDGSHKKSHYQGWRGVFATIAKTHHLNIEFDYQHHDARYFDRVIDNHATGSDYEYKPIINYDYDYKNRKQIVEETGHYEIRFKVKEYFRLAHTSDIYRQCGHYINRNIYLDSYYTSMILLPKFLTPLNQTDYDKYLASYTFSDEYAFDKYTLPILERLMSEDYPYNAYTQFILVACLFAKDKAVRLAGIDAIIFAISHFKLDPNMFAQHSSQWIQHFSAPFSRYVECITQLSQYESIYQKVVLDVIEKTIVQIEFKDKLPTNFKKYLEIYYLLLSSLNKKSDKNVIDKLQQWLEISNSIKTIVGKIGKL
ncbi:DUF6493 family protein [Moraxella sp. ZY210820]|uniref:DUF6493 family protein n=1 Tax=unclassified Moraxella TaxID=2685852 RepID=UPI00273195A5|nr:DUF6493 family protein [Moraxella sp. ZY210820]WLF83741.1 DUF6493 family protein [Moraxella sp. ZY210820]